MIEGDKISLIKKKEEWTSDVGNILESFSKTAKANSCTKGLCYSDYLKLLLFMLDDETLAYRMMEVMEIGMQSQKEYQNCRIDHMIMEVKYKIQFDAKPIFSSGSILREFYTESYSFLKEVSRSYIP